MCTQPLCSWQRLISAAQDAFVCLNPECGMGILRWYSFELGYHWRPKWNLQDRLHSSTHWTESHGGSCRHWCQQHQCSLDTLDSLHSQQWCSFLLHWVFPINAMIMIIWEREGERESGIRLNTFRSPNWWPGIFLFEVWAWYTVHQSKLVVDKCIVIE